MLLAIAPCATAQQNPSAPAVVPVAAPASTAQAVPQQLETVRVQGNYVNAVGTTDAASAGTVTSKLIESRPTLRPAEVLEFVPGVIVTQHSGDGKANQYFLRGFNLDHGTDFATFVDGMPVNMPTHAHGHGYTDLNWLIPELVDRLRYRKGPYYAEEGDFSSAGSARIDLFDGLPRGVAAATLGQDRYARALLAHTSSLGEGKLTYALEGAHNDGPWQNPEKFHRMNGVLRYTFGDDANRSSITAMGYSAGWNSTDQIPQRAVDAGLIDRFGAIDPTDGGHTERYSLSFQTVRRLGDGEFRLNAYAIASRLNLFSNFTFFLEHPIDLDPAESNGDQFEQAERRKVLGLAARRTWNIRLGAVDTVNTLGVQVRQDRLDPVGLYAAVARERTAATQESAVRQTSVALYAENLTQWQPWFRSVAGLRGDRFDFKVSSSIPQNSGKANDSIVSPKLSLVFGPWSKTEYFVNYGLGFHSNDARGTTATVAAKSRDPVDPVTPLVRSKGGELGSAHGDRFGAAELARALAIEARLGVALRRRRGRDRAEPGEPASRHRMEQPLSRHAVAPARCRPRGVAGSLHGRRSGRQLHPRLDRQGGVGRSDHRRPRCVVWPVPVALLRAAAADRGQLCPLEIDDAGLSARRIQDLAEPEGRARRVQPVRSQGQRHRLFLHVAAAGRAGGRHRRRPLPSGRAAALSGQSCGELLDGAPGRIRTS